MNTPMVEKDTPCLPSVSPRRRRQRSVATARSATTWKWTSPVHAHTPSPGHDLRTLRLQIIIADTQGFAECTLPAPPLRSETRKPPTQSGWQKQLTPNLASFAGLQLQWHLSQIADSAGSPRTRHYLPYPRTPGDRRIPRPAFSHRLRLPAPGFPATRPAGPAPAAGALDAVAAPAGAEPGGGRFDAGVVGLHAVRAAASRSACAHVLGVRHRRHAGRHSPGPPGSPPPSASRRTAAGRFRGLGLAVAGGLRRAAGGGRLPLLVPGLPGLHPRP